MKLTVNYKKEFTVADVEKFSELNNKIKLCMNSLKTKKATFKLEGEAEIKEVIELDCLFG